MELIGLSGGVAVGNMPSSSATCCRRRGATAVLGTNKVKLHVLQNGVADTLTGHYAPAPPGTALEVPKFLLAGLSDRRGPFGNADAGFRVRSNPRA